MCGKKLTHASLTRVLRPHLSVSPQDYTTAAFVVVVVIVVVGLRNTL